MAIYLSRKKGGTVATPITPSNSSPAQMTANTPVNPTTNGYAIESYNTKTPSNSSPVALTSGEIDKIGGNGYAIQSYDMIMPSSTPTSVSAFDVVMIGGSGVIVDSIPIPPSITPSNASPAALTSGSAVTPTANGYAIASYSLADPAEGTRMTSGNFYKATDNGLIIDDIETLAAGSGTDDTIEDGKNYHAVGSGIAIQGFTSITPSNSSPVSLSSGDYYKPSAGGYAIESYSTVTPQEGIANQLVSGSLVKMNGSGYGIKDFTQITPSNAAPVSLSSSKFYKASASGYAISSYSSKTPSDSSPASVSSGAIIKASSSGYLYKTLQTKGITLLESITISDTSNHTITFSQTLNNFRYILIIMGDGAADFATNKSYGNVVPSGGRVECSIIFDTDKYVSGFTVTGGYSKGSGTTLALQTLTATYSATNKIILKQNNATARTTYIYGLN